ncbi:ABC transporter substrate-binding protein [Flexivirga caeni]|uniref:Amino acid ABC transporter substrate-binding protein n=1 Tax=Flexivirga caeni TaxID=2294115 RepID=A0A3M9MIH0_9MICO|nr:ABC transporter substrate-binding protein [Flexivirga caeni]RNI25370.1 amino acid ABC transporter substrate-binding protein [Flexivirga caeni]
MALKRTLTIASAVALAASLGACSSSSGGSKNGGSESGAPAKATTAKYGNCKITSKPDSIKIKPVVPDTLTVETTLPAQGWWNGTTADSIKDGYEYCMAAELANMAGLKKLSIKNVSFDQLVAGHTNNFDIALAEISITPERAKVVEFSKPYFDSNIGVLTKKGAGVTADNITSKRCAAYSGTTSVDFLKTKLKCKSQKIYPDSQTLYQAVLSGQTDVALLDTAIVLAEAKQTGNKLEVPGQYKTGEKYGAIYPKGSANAAELDKGITTLQADGVLKYLSKTYLGPAFGGDPSSVPVWSLK